MKLAKILIPFGIIVTLSYVPMFFPAEWVDLFVREDRIYESLGALFFLIAALIFGFAFFRVDRRLAYLAFAVVFIIFAGEEISWGQRIFRTGDSELVRNINAQQETNIHNLKFLDANRGTAGLLSAGTLFLIFVLAVWLFIPLIAAAYEPGKQFFASFMPIFSLQLFLLMILNFALFFAVGIFLNSYPALYHHRWMSFDWALTEVLEFDTALILLVITAYHVFALASGDAIPRDDAPADAQ